jgi:hypothetical protein
MRYRSTTKNIKKANMSYKKLDHPFWDACRFYIFFWVWASPAYWLISSNIQNEAARKEEGLSPPYLFYLIIVLSLVSASYTLISWKSIMLYNKEQLHSKIYHKKLNILRKIQGFGFIVCLITTFSSGFVVHKFIEYFISNSKYEFYIEYYISSNSILEICLTFISGGGVLLFLLLGEYD